MTYLYFFASKIYAQDIGQIQIPLGFLDIGCLFSRFLVLIYFAAGVFFLVQITVGGLSFLNSGGDPKALDAARDRITNAVIGLVIVAAAFGLTWIVTNAFGINIFSGPVTIN